MSKSAIYDLTEPAAYFRLDGRLHQIVRFDGANREVFECETGETFSISHDDWIVLCDEAKVTEDFSFRAREAINANLARPWDTFTPRERQSALDRHPYYMAMDRLGAKPWERRSEFLIEELMARVRQDNPNLPTISVPAFRKWDTRWIDSGRDIRGLCDLDFKKGNRSDPEELKWINKEIDEAIQTYMLKSPRLKARQVSSKLQTRLLTKAADEGLALPCRVKTGNSIGHFRVQRRVHELNFRERKVAEKGLKEAKRLSAGVSKGPQPDRPLMESEADHSKLDIILVDGDGNELGRAWLTTIFDRCTRQVQGYHIGFASPSWSSLLQALLVAVRVKKPLLDAVDDYTFINALMCYGMITSLYVDRGQEFIGNELAAFGALIGCLIRPLPRASGSKKGKVERNYGTINNSFISELPGHVGNRPDKIIREEFMPRMTLKELNRLFLIWWVDKYQTDEITGVGKPKLLWEEKLTPGFRRLQPSEDLLGPFESPLHTRWLRETGIRIDNFFYHSDELRMLLHRLGEEQQVIVRPDIHDGNVIHVFDSEARVFVQGKLEGVYAGLKLTRAELLERYKKDHAPKQTLAELIQEARGKNQFHDEIDRYTRRHEQTLPDLSLPSQKASEFVEREIYNPEASAAPLGSHDEGLDIEPNSHDVRGSHHSASAYTQVTDGRLKVTPIPGLPKPPTLERSHFVDGSGTASAPNIGQTVSDLPSNPSRDGPALPEESTIVVDDDDDDDDVQGW